MPENEFEKKVSSEMQDLRFKPSENVWLRVEERIKKKKKRRIFVIIFLLAGLALLGYWQRSNLFGEIKNDIAKTEKQKDENSKSAEEANNSSAIKQNTETTKKEETESTTINDVNDKSKDDKSFDDKKDIAVSKNELIRPKKNKNETNVKPVSKKTKIDNNAEVPTAIASANSKKKNTIIDDGKTKDAREVKTSPETIAKPEEIKQPEVKPVESKIDSAKVVIHEQEKNDPIKSDTLLKRDPKKDPTPEIVKKDSSAKKWKWGVHVTPGISSLNDNGISFGGSKSADAFAYQNPVGSGTASPPPVQQKPSDIKAGFAFHVGAFAQRQLSPRTNFSLGVQYGYYSNVLHIGNRRNSLIGNAQLSAILDRNAN
ncbi:MAG TPA: hypothetical protein VFU29_18430, partial [Chitinophagaceae bacterium]|nr:hypothetical protein [Chitinophagaceae bacterium]